MSAVISDDLRDQYGYGGPQCCRIVGCSYRQLDYWARTGIVAPSIVDASGSGSQRRYSSQDLLRLQIVKVLLTAGQSLAGARSVLDQVGDHLTEDLRGQLFVIATDAATVVRSKDLARSVATVGEAVLVVPMGVVVERLAASIERVDQLLQDERRPRPGPTAARAPRAKPVTVPEVDALAVPCPTCRAAAGDPCTEGGGTVRHTHFARAAS